jgi:hypothetical protein
MKYLFSIIVFILFQKQVCYSQYKSKKNSEKAQVKAVAIKAIKWYFYKYGRDENCKGFKYISGTEGDSLDPYRIDFKEASIFFDYLLERKIFSKKFTTDLLVYFKKCDSNFVAVKQYYSVPIGFEYNLITKDTDDMGIEGNINKSVISNYKKTGNTVYLSLKFTKYATYTFVLTKYNGRWLIDNINGDFQSLSSTPI